MEVIFYKNSSGREPVKDDIKKLERKDALKVASVLDSIKKDGFRALRVEFRQIEGKLWEIKIKLESGGYRIFYTIINIEKMVLLHSYKKKSQKAPKKELDVAFSRLKDYINNYYEE